MPYKGKATKGGKHAPLENEIEGDGLAQGKGRSKKRERQPDDQLMTVGRCSCDSINTRVESAFGSTAGSGLETKT